MAGHSKWSKVKYIKAVVDKRRGMLLSKRAREIVTVIKPGDGGPAGSLQLRAAIAATLTQSMTPEDIDRASNPCIGESQGSAGCEALECTEFFVDSRDLFYEPASKAVVSDRATAAQGRRICDALEDYDDVLNVHANFEMPEGFLGRISG